MSLPGAILASRARRCWTKSFNRRQVSSFMSLQDVDVDYYCNPKNLIEIANNIQRRKCAADIAQVQKLYQKIQNEGASVEDENQFIAELLKIPNKTHPITEKLTEPSIIKEVGSVRALGFKPKKFNELSKKRKLVREDTSVFTGSRSYYLMDEMASLEQALIQYSIQILLNNKFQLISVPDILNRATIEACGMETRGQRNQVYTLDPCFGSDLCMSGTAEMGIASYLQARPVHSKQLPLRIAAVSRCYRAETSKISDEKGIFRVHQFNKVEMFGVAESAQGSADLLHEFLEIEEQLFLGLDLPLRLVEIPPDDLGKQAYRKIDIETLLPGRGVWAELSSASDCLDYQTRRLGIKLTDTKCHPYTVNGTAAAIPRLLMALAETHQQKDGTLSLPSLLTKSPILNCIRTSCQQ